MIYLYIKQHDKSKKKYFGKTTSKNPFKYLGSGKYWQRHINKHGKMFVKTLEIWGFDNQTDATAFAIKFSIENNIVNSEEWANEIIENALDGAPVGHKGHKFTQEQLQSISNRSKEMWSDPEFKNVMREKHKGCWDEDRKSKQSQRLKGIKRPDHSEKLKGRKLSEEVKSKMRKPKHPGHGALVSKGLKGLKKSETHRKNLGGPKNRVCRILDKKEMSVGHFTRWINSTFQ